MIFPFLSFRKWVFILNKKRVWYRYFTKKGKWTPFVLFTKRNTEYAAILISMIRDMKKHLARIRIDKEKNEIFSKEYDMWMSVLNFKSDKGVVQFHPVDPNVFENNIRPIDKTQRLPNP